MAPLGKQVSSAHAQKMFAFLSAHLLAAQPPMARCLLPAGHHAALGKQTPHRELRSNTGAKLHTQSKTPPPPCTPTGKRIYFPGPRGGIKNRFFNGGTPALQEVGFLFF